MGSVLTQYGRNRARDQDEVAHRRPGIDVVIVQLHPMLERHFRAAVDLPQTGKALRHAETALGERVVVGDLAGQSGTRPDQRHVAEQNVEQIRQLVDRGLAQEAPERMQTRIVPDLKDRTRNFVEVHQVLAHRVGAVDHRAQFVHLEAPAAHTNPLLREKRLPPADAHDADRRRDDNRRDEHEQGQAERYVGQAFDGPPGLGDGAFERGGNGDLHARYRPANAALTVAPTKSRPSTSPSTAPGAALRWTNGTYSRV